MTQITEVVCPFCSLLCDNLTIDNNHSKLVVAHGCGKASQAYKHFKPKLSNQINNANTSLEKAITRASRIIKQSKRPLIAGLGTDVTGMRSIMELADKTGAYLDHMHAGSISNYRVLQDKGYMLTTLGEIKNRADLILCVGTDVVRYWPEFFNRFIWTDKTLSGLDPAEREIIYIGTGLKTQPGIRPDGKKPLHLKCDNEEATEIIGALRAILMGKSLSQTQVAGISIKRIHILADYIRRAHFGVLLWSAASFKDEFADLHIQNFCEFVKERNVEKRFSGMPIASPDGAMSAYSTAAWQSGYPLRTRFLKGFPEYNPDKFQTEKLIRDEEVDVLIWISSFSSQVAPPDFDGPTVVLADGNSPHGHQTDVYIPISTPGVDQAGQMQRTDSVISLNMKSVIDTHLPRLDEVIGNIMQKL